MAFTTSYSVGGVIDEIKKITFPVHLFPQKTTPYIKGLRMNVPAIAGTYVATYTPEVDVELCNIAIACSAYNDTDYWEAHVGDVQIAETVYLKELPESYNMGNVLYIIYRVPAGTEIQLAYHNASGTSKIVWFNLRFLK